MDRDRNRGDGTGLCLPGLSAIRTLDEVCEQSCMHSAALGSDLFMTSLSTMELSTTTICSGILTSTERSPKEKRARAVTQCPPGLSKENDTRSFEGSLLSRSLKEK